MYVSASLPDETSKKEEVISSVVNIDSSVVNDVLQNCQECQKVDKVLCTKNEKGEYTDYSGKITMKEENGVIKDSSGMFVGQDCGCKKEEIPEKGKLTETGVYQDKSVDETAAKNQAETLKKVSEQAGASDGAMQTEKGETSVAANGATGAEGTSQESAQNDTNAGEESKSTGEAAASKSSVEQTSTEGISEATESKSISEGSDNKITEGNGSKTTEGAINKPAADNMTNPLEKGKVESQTNGESENLLETDNKPTEHKMLEKPNVQEKDMAQQPVQDKKDNIKLPSDASAPSSPTVSIPESCDDAPVSALRIKIKNACRSKIQKHPSGIITKTVTAKANTVTETVTLTIYSTITETLQLPSDTVTLPPDIRTTTIQLPGDVIVKTQDPETVTVTEYKTVTVNEIKKQEKVDKEITVSTTVVLEDDDIGDEVECEQECSCDEEVCENPCERIKCVIVEA